MANEERGEVELVAGERSYTLALSMNAIAEMQAKTGKTYGETIRAIRSLDIVALRDVLWMTLKKHHKKDFPNPDKVGDLVDSLDGGMNTAIVTLNRLLEVNQDRGKQAEQTDPPTAQ